MDTLQQEHQAKEEQLEGNGHHLLHTDIPSSKPDNSNGVHNAEPSTSNAPHSETQDTTPSTKLGSILRRRLKALKFTQIHAALQTILVIIDIAMLSFAFVLGYYARATLPFPNVPVGNPPPLGEYLPMLGIHTVTITILFYFTRMYHMHRGINRFDLGITIAQNVSIGTFIAIAIETLAFKNSTLDLDYPRGVIVYAWLFSLVTVVLGRELHRQLVVRLRKAGIGRDQLLIIGNGSIAARIIGRIKRSPQLGFDVIGIVSHEHAESQQETDTDESLTIDVPLLGDYEELPTIIDTRQINHVIIALPDATRRELATLISLCQRGTVDIKIYPDTFAFITSGLTVDQLSGMPLLGVRDLSLRGWKLSLKRGLDFVGSTLGLIFLSPFMLLLATLIYLTDRGPVFFCQERVGLDGKPFPMIKFRTMSIDAEQKGNWTVPNDSRVTRIGAILRRSNLDELPNLINVFFGHMSLVGPRPEQERFVEEFKEKIPRYMERHREKSGMTGWAQVNGLRGDTSIQERLKYDLYYVENWSLWFDVKIILRTVAQTILFRNRNAY